MDRRDFFKATLASAGLLAIGDFEELYARGAGMPQVGKPWTGWKKGHFQVHFIYTGVAESMFMIFPDGTTMLLDCGDHDAASRADKAVAILPHYGKHSGEWIARYVRRVNPNGADVDYMMLSHYHNDHAGGEGFYASKETWNGEDYYLSGFSQAGKFLTFKKAVDRAWPTFDDPIPLPDDYNKGTLRQMKKFYERISREQGTVIERFRLGSTDQIIPLRDPESCKGFMVRNICANGRVCAEDGTIRDLYAETIAREHPDKLSENGMSLGMVISYGPFRFFTAGDFSDMVETADGNAIRTEDVLAEICGPANVAKVNHHGHHSMSEKLVSALRSQVYVSCVWDTLHNTQDTLKRLTDRNLYPDKRIICPGIFPAARRATDYDKPWLEDISNSSFGGGHVVLDVEPGGRRFSITYLNAADESMTVRSVMDFYTENRT